MNTFKRLKEHYDSGFYHNDEIVNIIAECLFELEKRVARLEKKKRAPDKLREKAPKKKGMFSFGKAN